MGSISFNSNERPPPEIPSHTEAQSASSSSFHAEARSLRAGSNRVLVHREGRRVILEPVDEWPPEFLACLGAWTEEIERPPAEPISELKDPFE